MVIQNGFLKKYRTELFSVYILVITLATLEYSNHLREKVFGTEEIPFEVFLVSLSISLTLLFAKCLERFLKIDYFKDARKFLTLFIALPIGVGLTLALSIIFIIDTMMNLIQKI